MPNPEVRRFANPAMLAEGTADHIARLVVEAMRDRGECRIALVGRSTPRLVYEQLAAVERAHRVRWSAVHVFFGDERCVPLDDEQSNYRMPRQSSLCHVPIPEQNMHRIHGEIDPEEAAQRYAARLGDTPLDLVLLGMGDDSHTASLFPNTPALGEATARTVVTESPRPPPTRISLSLRTLDEARRVLFVVAGASKPERPSEVLAPGAEPQPHPARRDGTTGQRPTGMVRRRTRGSASRQPPLTKGSLS